MNFFILKFVGTQIGKQWITGKRGQFGAYGKYGNWEIYGKWGKLENGKWKIKEYGENGKHLKLLNLLVIF